MPISSTDITAGVGRYASAIDDDSKDDEAGNGDHLDDTEDEFN